MYNILSQLPPQLSQRHNSSNEVSYILYGKSGPLIEPKYIHVFMKYLNTYMGALQGKLRKIYTANAPAHLKIHKSKFWTVKG